ncbi:MAG: DUF2846 domain-containing protein [Terracidiphilus sp.]|jgi:hypothetical protein
MKIGLIALLFAASAWAQDPAAIASAACGRENVTFKVELDESRHIPAQPAPGKALVYVIHDAGTSSLFAYPTTKLGVDGKWVGANHGNSYLVFPVEPGEHHLCTTLQSSIIEDREELAHFTAEAGKVYYFRTRLVLSRSVDLLELQPVDSDQGKFLVAVYPLSISTPKK